MKRTAVRATHFRGVLFSTVSFFSFVALALVLWQGGIITMKQAMEIGTLSVFMSYAQGLMEPLICFDAYQHSGQHRARDKAA